MHDCIFRSVHRSKKVTESNVEINSRVQEENKHLTRHTNSCGIAQPHVMKNYLWSFARIVCACHNVMFLQQQVT